MRNKLVLYILSAFLVFSCKSEEQKKEEATPLHTRGEITLQYDDSFTNIAEALSQRYMKVYPNAKINLKVSKEDQALEDLLNHKVDMIIMSRELTEQERKYWDSKTKLPWQPSYFAADAVCFVVNKNSEKQHVSLEEIKEMLKSGDKKLIFDGANTSNLNAVLQKLNLDIKDVKYSRLEGNEKIIESLEKFSNHIGVISYNTISRPYGERATKLRENIKILPIKVGDSLLLPNKENLKTQKYPLTKLLYFLTDEGTFGLANGLIRYSCTHIGQKIVDKEGLQPYNLYPRTINIINN